MKIKVLHIITKLELGGAQGNTLYTVKHLDPGKFEVSLACGPGGILDGETAGINVHFVAELAREINPLKDFAAVMRLRSLIKKISPDVVHTHSSKAGILGRIAAKLAGVPAVIHTFHGFGFNPEQRFLTRFAFTSAEKICAPLSDALIFVSKANESEARGLGIGRGVKSRVIRSGIKLSGYPARDFDAAKLRAELKIPDKAEIVLSVGNLKPQKNPLDFAASAKIVCSERPDCVFIFAGDGELRPEVERFVSENGLAGKCLFPGWRRDTDKLLAMAKVFVLSSLWEGLPRALVEALKSGVPCVAYGCDGVSDILKDGENGFLIKPKDTKTLAEKISAILADDGLHAKLAAGAAATGLSEFDIDGMVKAQENLYLELTAKK